MVDSIVTKTNNPVVFFPDWAYKLIRHPRADGNLKAGYLCHVDADVIDGNDQETIVGLFVIGKHESIPIDTVITENYRINAFPCIPGAIFYLPTKASRGTITKDVTILIPSADTDGTLEIYTESLLVASGAATASAVDATRPTVSGNYLPPVKFLALEALTDTADVEWVKVMVF